MTLLTTLTSGGTGVGIAAQNYLDETSNGVQWAMVLSNGENGRLRFFYSTDKGGTWSEDVSARIADRKITAGGSMYIGTNSSGVDALVAVDVRNAGGSTGNKPHVHFGTFNANRTAVTWRHHRPVGAASSDYLHPVVAISPAGDKWWVHMGYVENGATDRSDFFLKRSRYNSVGGEEADYTPVVAYHAVSSVHGQMGLDVRHLGFPDRPDTDADLYMGWHRGSTTDADAYTRVYAARIAADGQDWNYTTLSGGAGYRILDPDFEAASRLFAVNYTGERFVTAHVPENSGTDIVLYLMTPTDISFPQKITCPAPGLGDIVALDVTHDGHKHDIWIVAAGTTTRRPYYIKYDWASRTFGSWTQINTHALIDDALSAKPNNRSSRIDILYGVDAGGGNTEVHSANVAVTNQAPTVAWLTAPGVYDVAQPLTLSHLYADADGDTQASVTYERQVNGGASAYYNGSTWQAGVIALVTSAATQELPAGWAADGDEVQYWVTVSDGVASSAKSAALVIDAAAAVALTIDSPTTGSQINDPTVTVAWTAGDQVAYRIRVLSGGEERSNTGWQPSAVLQESDVDFLFSTNTTYTIEVGVRGSSGIEVTDTVDITIVWLPPPVASVVQTEYLVDDEPAAFELLIDNPPETGGQPAVARNLISRVVQVGDAAATETPIAYVEVDAVYVDWAAPSVVDVSYVVTAIAADGRSQRSDIVQNLLTFGQSTLEPVGAAGEFSAGPSTTVTRTTSTPSPVGGTPGFQADAFQPDAFQTGQTGQTLASSPIEGEASLALEAAADTSTVEATTTPVPADYGPAHAVMVDIIDDGGLVDGQVEVEYLDEDGVVIDSATSQWVQQQVRTTQPGTTDRIMLSEFPTRITSTPANGLAVSGTDNYLWLSTSDDTRVQVDWWLDGVFHRTDSTPPFDFQGGAVRTAADWDVTAVAKGAHTIEARAVDGTVLAAAIVHVI